MLPPEFNDGQGFSAERFGELAVKLALKANSDPDIDASEGLRILWAVYWTMQETISKDQRIAAMEGYLNNLVEDKRAYLEEENNGSNRLQDIAREENRKFTPKPF